MPKLILKHPDHPQPQVKKELKVMSEEQLAIVQKLKNELQIAQAGERKALEQKTYFERKYNGSPIHQSETMIGSGLTQFLVPRGQDKYHLVRWNFAVRSAKRRVRDLTKILKTKLKGHG